MVYSQRKTLGKYPIQTAFQKHLEIHITKEVKDLYNENFKILKKETEEETRSGENFNAPSLTELIL